MSRATADLAGEGLPPKLDVNEAAGEFTHVYRAVNDVIDRAYNLSRDVARIAQEMTGSASSHSSGMNVWEVRRMSIP